MKRTSAAFHEKYHDDRYLLRSWIPQYPPRDSVNTDVAFKCGATEAFVPLHPDPVPPENVSGFTIATWNARELMVRNHSKKTVRELGEKARTLREMNADVVALEEVVSLQDLDAFQRQYLGNDAYPYRVLVDGNDRWINVALMSRFPIKKVYTYRDHPVPGLRKEQPYFVRDLLEAVVQITPKDSVTVFVCHLKSKIGPRAAIIRKAESQEVRRIVAKHLAENPESLIAVAGDFNDTPDSETVETLDGGPRLLEDPLERENREEQPTEHSDRYGDSRADYLLLSPALMRHYVSGSARVLESESSRESSDHDPVEIGLGKFSKVMAFTSTQKPAWQQKHQAARLSFQFQA